MAQTQIHVKVDRVAFSKPMNKRFWMIIVTDLGTCKGNMYWEPKQGEQLIFEGEWTVYQGRKEFQFKSASPDIPQDSRAQLAYICRITDGVGEALEGKIWEALGEDWHKIDDGDVKGMTGKKLAAFREAMEQLKTNIVQVNTISFLMAKGASFNMSNAAWEQWEKETIGIVQADCFSLTNLPQYGFSHVDKGIRQNFGIADNDTRRIRAGILYTMRQLQADGSTIVEWNRLNDEAVKILKTSRDLVLSEASKMIQEKTLKGFNVEGGLIATAYDFDNENLIWEYAIND